MRVSLVNQATDTECKTARVSDVIASIQTGEYRSEIEAIRDAYAAGGKKAADPLKKKLPAVLWSGTFYKRSNDALEDHSGLICADLDNLADAADDIREKAIRDPLTFCAFASPTGAGLKVVFRCDPKRPHIESFRAAERYVKDRFGCEIDPACKDVARLCFLSWDPDIYYAPNVEPLPYVEAPPRAPVLTEKSTPAAPVSRMPTAEDVRALLRSIPARPPYGDWLKICSAVWSVLSMEEGCRVLMEWSPEETPGEYAAKHRKKLDRVGFGTLVFYAKLNGFRPDPGMRATIAAAQAATETTATAWPAPVSALALCSEPPAVPPEIIRGLMYQGGTMMLSGASKSRKTYTMLALGLSVAGGHDWLGFKTIHCPVLYLNLELQDFATAQRLRAIAKAMGIEPSRNLHVVNLRGKLVSVESLENRIEELIESTGAGLVVLDPHYKLSSASDVEENSNDGQALLLYRIENAICSSGAGVVLAHHFSKGDQSQKKAMDRAAGGGALARWPDVVMTMTEHEQPDCVTAEFALRNFAPVAPFVLRWDRATWKRDDAMNPAALKKAGRVDDHPAEYLLSCLRDGMLNREWLAASGWADGTYRRKRDHLVTSGAVTTRTGCFYHAPPQSPE